MTTTSFRQTVGTLLIVTSVVALSWSGVVTIRADYTKWRYTRMPPADTVDVPRPGMPIGLLTVPRLRLSSVVVEGDSPASLQLAAGHLPDTPFPWEAGNSALAGHRDSDFRWLKDLRSGDVIRFATAGTALDYVVSNMKVVEPADLSVLRQTREPTLTLITCYPFRYVGTAPQRFVVRAERMDEPPRAR